MERFILEANIAAFQRRLDNAVDPGYRKLLKEL